MQSNHVQTADLRFQYLQRGTGFPVILLHGFPETSRMWRHQIGPLSERFSVFAPDTRGFGGTDKPRIRPTRELLARDVLDFMDALGIERTALVGHDWGGIIAFKMAIDHPERVERLALVDTLTTVWIPWGIHGYWFKAEPLPEEFHAKHAREFIDLVFGGRPGTWEGPPSAPWPPTLTEEYDPQRWIDAETLEHYRRAFADPDTHWNAIHYYRDALPFHIVTPDASLLHGEHCEFLGEKHIAEMWNHPEGLGAHPLYQKHFFDFGPEDRHKRYPNPALFVFSPYMIPEAFKPGPPSEGYVPAGNPYAESFPRYFPQLRAQGVASGHFIPEEQPETMTQLLLTFLASTP